MLLWFSKLKDKIDIFMESPHNRNIENKRKPQPSLLSSISLKGGTTTKNEEREIMWKYLDENLQKSKKNF